MYITRYVIQKLESFVQDYITRYVIQKLESLV